jgi:hypothetical protein
MRMTMIVRITINIRKAIEERSRRRMGGRIRE